MGREWYRVVGGSGSGGRSSKSKKDAKTAASGGSERNAGDKKSVMKEANTTATIAGCMNAVLHLFDFHHFQFPVTNHHHRDSSSSSSKFDSSHDDLLPPELPLPKGVEAPRNSFESTEEAHMSPIRRDENLNISMGIQIKTKPRRSSKLESLTSTESDSPSTKTPTLVARLMGLDLIPDKSLSSPSSSPTPSSCSSALSVDFGSLRTKPQSKRQKQYSLHRNSVDGGTRSLPETPRISLGRRSDVDYYQRHRLSLQLNRDHVNVSEQERGQARLPSSRLKEMKIDDDKENRSPREYARQIVMQLKENVSRRMGTDITNTARNKERTRDHHHHNHDPKKASKTTSSDSSVPSCSPKLRFMEKSRPTSPKPASPTSQRNLIAQIIEDKLRLQTVQEEPLAEHGQEEEQRRGQVAREGEMLRKSVKKFKKPDNEIKFGSRLVKPPQTMQEEPFVRSPVGKRLSSSGNLIYHHHHLQGDKKGKKISMSTNDRVNFTIVPSLFPVKKKEQSNLHVDALKVTETQTPRKKASEFPSCSSQSHLRIVRKDVTPSTISAAELNYVTRILRRTGIDKDTPVSYAKWFSPSHPLDPSIFYFLEHFAISSVRTKSSPEYLGIRCNRKLLFQLVDEILIDILKPQMNMKPWVRHYQSRRNLLGSELIDELCRRIGQLPLVDCQVLEDIDTLVAGDYPQMKVERDSAFEEESEGIVSELERQILETLVSETTTEW